MTFTTHRGGLTPAELRAIRNRIGSTMRSGGLREWEQHVVRTLIGSAVRRGGLRQYELRDARLLIAGDVVDDSGSDPSASDPSASDPSASGGGGGSLPQLYDFDEANEEPIDPAIFTQLDTSAPVSCYDGHGYALGGAAYDALNVYSPDQISQITLTNLNAIVWLTLRGSGQDGTATYYRVVIHNSGFLGVFQVINGLAVQIGSYEVYTWHAGDVVRAKVTGLVTPVVSIYVNGGGSPIFTFTDESGTPIVAGGPGPGMQGTGQMNNWVGDNA